MLLLNDVSFFRLFENVQLLLITTNVNYQLFSLDNRKIDTKRKPTFTVTQNSPVYNYFRYTFRWDTDNVHNLMTDYSNACIMMLPLTSFSLSLYFYFIASLVLFFVSHTFLDSVCSVKKKLCVCAFFCEIDSRHTE